MHLYILNKTLRLQCPNKACFLYWGPTVLLYDLQGLTPQQILILEAEVVRAATTQAQRNKELQNESRDLLEPRKEGSDPLPSTSGSLPGPIPNWDQLKRQQQGALLGKPEHTPRRWGP